MLFGHIGKLIPGADEQANIMGEEKPSAEHFVLSALCLEDGTAKRAFNKLGIDSKKFQNAIKAQYDEALSSVGISERIKNISSALEVEDDDYFWTYLSCALISVVRIDDIEIQNMVVVDQKSYALFLIHSIEKHLTSQSTRTQ